MKDEIILRLLEDACKKLERVSFPVETPHLLPVYNALLAAVQANHPGNVYLRALRPMEEGEKANATPEEIKVLLGQLRIVLESLTEEQTQPQSMGTGPVNRAVVPATAPTE